MKWTPGTVVAKKVWTDGLFTLSVRAPDVQPFAAGQFLQLAMQEGDARVNRPYSVASPHGELLEFFIVLVPGGKLTPRLWGLDVGDQVEVSQKATGSFTLSKTPEAKHLWLIATGTGLAPYVAMLRESEIWERFEKVVVVHGVRWVRDLAYQEEFAGYQQKYGDRFSYIPTTSRESSEGIFQGRIPQLLESGELESIGGAVRRDDCSVLLCGNPAMLDEMEQRLGNRQMIRHKTKQPGQIVLERYW